MDLRATMFVSTFLLLQVIACKTHSSSSSGKDLEHISSLTRNTDGTFRVICLRDVNNPSEFYIEPNTTHPEPVTAESLRQNQVCKQSGAPTSACTYDPASRSFEVFYDGQFYRRGMDGPPEAMRCGSFLSAAFDGDEIFVFSTEQRTFLAVNVDADGRKDLEISSHMVMYFDGDEVFLISRGLILQRINVDANGTTPGRYSLHNNGMFFYDSDELFVGCVTTSGGFAPVKRFEVDNAQESTYQAGQSGNSAFVKVGGQRITLDLATCVSTKVL